MSSSSSQRLYPIPPLLPQLADSMLKVIQMLVLNHCHVLISESVDRAVPVQSLSRAIARLGF
jgi:hypothetical protein